MAFVNRIERVKLSCVYSKVKLVGTLVCVGGALTMSIMHSAAPTSPTSTSSSAVDDTALLTSTALDRQPYNQDDNAHIINHMFDKQKMMGCFYLLAAVFVLSTNIVLQAATLREFPAPMSLCAATSLIGVVLTAAVQLLQEHKLEAGWPLLTIPHFIACSLLVSTCVRLINY